MAVNLEPPRPEDLLPVRGVKLGVAEAGVRKFGRKDLLLVTLAEGSRVAGVFTQNRFCAAPVQVAKEHLASGGPTRALLVNTGNANAGTGREGLARARASCAEAARLLGCDSQQVLRRHKRLRSDSREPPEERRPPWLVQWRWRPRP